MRRAAIAAARAELPVYCDASHDLGSREADLPVTKRPSNDTPHARPGHAPDTVFLHGLEVDCVIGIWDWERQFKQTLEIDVDLATDTRQAARSDSIADTIDYKAVTKRILQLAETGGFLLVEALAEAIAQAVLTEFDVPWTRIRINKKCAVRQVREVGVLIERARPVG